MLRIYKVMIRSKIDYGANTLVSALRSHYKRLDVVQNKILGRITGALKSTPVALLHLETGTIPIMERCKFLASCYLTRLAFRKANPAYETIHKIKNYQLAWNKRGEASAAITLDEIQIEYLFTDEPKDTRDDIPPKPPWTLTPVYTSVFPLSKNEALNNPHLARSTFISWAPPDSSQHLSIFTDGSLDPDGSSACSLYCPKLNISRSWKLADNSTILNCELWAISKALDLVNSVDYASCSIFTESKSVLCCASNPSLGFPVM